ncbi:MAG TPA: acyl-CoA dehydrogenase [Quisquiliibacterium sp.]|nr:acyl-CoA dehydrogenase [Quisquiliibacterium sp.]HQN11587.1 acyl-CoA dehydrogenase [Quisquiliibacterium sp.]HQP65806.1 acyl-CoA dehydrogenase [Quisquiliibacterium sp.]
MDSKILSRRDLSFLLHEWLDVAALTSRPRFADHSRETFDAALDTAARIATEQFAPINRLLDTDEPRFDGERVHTPEPLKKALRAFCDAGMMSAGFDAAHGGMQLPYTVERACFAWFNGASIGAAAYPLLTMGNANLLLAHGSPEQVATWVPPMLAGQWFGTMCLSEPQAGSSLSDIRTRAEPQPDGSYRLFGNKMWISGGEQDLTENIVHLVLAKIPNADGSLPPGVKGISLFLVPKVLLDAQGGLGERNDVTLAGLNHKMGYRGTTNTLLNFGEGRHLPGGRAGAVGQLVGQPGQGLSCMFHMMNEARIGVGMGAVMLGYTAYLHALDYARNRPQGRPPKGKDPAAPQVPIVAHADVRRMLLAQKAYVEGGLALTLYCARLVDEQNSAPDAAARADAHRLLELLTPVAKSWPSQWCQEANSLAIQVHGGYGYTRDYPVEQFYRDQRLNPIHEGTHGIQGLDLLGRKVRMESGAAMTAYGVALDRTASAARGVGGEWSDAADALLRWRARIDAVIARLHGCGDVDRTLANASVFLEAFGHHVVAWLWLEQAIAAARARDALPPQAADAERAFYDGKLQAARFFLRWELPRIGPMLDLLDSIDTTTLDMRDAWF